MFRKIADSVEMSFEIPDSEKKIAAEAKMRFEATANSLKFAVEHLDHIYDPFQKHTEISTESVIENRGIIQGRYSTKIKENFNEVKSYALLAIRKLNHFSVGDSTIRELINSFIEGVDVLEEGVSNLLSIFNNDYKEEEFRNKVIKTIDKIRSNAKELEDLIYDRIIDHIDVEILTRNWMNETDENYNLDKENVPLLVQLFEEREKQLNPESFPSSEKSKQSLNPSDAQRMWYPDRMPHDTNIGNPGE